MGNQNKADEHIKLCIFFQPKRLIALNRLHGSGKGGEGDDIFHRIRINITSIELYKEEVIPKRKKKNKNSTLEEGFFLFKKGGFFLLYKNYKCNFSKSMQFFCLSFH